jgi:putative flippase GtrA
VTATRATAPSAEGGPRSSRAGVLQFVRFSCVGGAAYAVNVVGFAAIIRWTEIPPLAAASIAFAVGWVFALVAHRRWSCATSSPAR